MSIKFTGTVQILAIVGASVLLFSTILLIAGLSKNETVLEVAKTEEKLK
jgi:hypothetical protein